MTDYDKCTDKEISDLLEELNRELVKKGLLHAGDDAVMMVAFRRLKEYGNMPNLRGHNLNDEEWDELHRKFEQLHFRNTPRDYEQQAADYAKYPIQFSIYRKLGLLHRFYPCENDTNRIHCSRVAEYITNPHGDIAQELFETIAKEAGIDDTWSQEGEQAISKYFGEHLMDVIRPQFRCEKHIRKLKEIAIKI